MTGLHLHDTDDSSSDARTRHPALYAVVEVVLLGALAVLIYGLVQLA